MINCDIIQVPSDCLRNVEARPELSVLLGIAPDGPESGYGWIEPAQRVPFTDAPVLRVGRFWEKPAAHVARELMTRGCLWNSFVMVARISTLLSLFMIAKPQLYFSFSAIRPTLGTVFEEATLKTLYADLTSSDFSAEILALFPINLAVLPVSGVQWSDLGEPRRVIDALARTGLRPQWAVA
jgi:mannose-1-phosphate guanylyltransferase